MLFRFITLYLRCWIDLIFLPTKKLIFFFTPYYSVFLLSGRKCSTTFKKKKASVPVHSGFSQDRVTFCSSQEGHGQDRRFFFTTSCGCQGMGEGKLFGKNRFLQILQAWQREPSGTVYYHLASFPCELFLFLCPLSLILFLLLILFLSHCCLQ